MRNYDPNRVTALTHQLLTAATPDGHNEISVGASPGEFAAVVQASATVIGCLLKWLAAEREESEEQVAAQLHADLLLLQLDGREGCFPSGGIAEPFDSSPLPRSWPMTD